MNIPIWQQRFLVSAPYRVYPAHNCEDRMLLIWNPEGTYQIYAWDAKDDSKRQLTYDQSGQIFGAINCDGTYIFTPISQAGSEIGHVHAISWKDGYKKDITPNLPLYTTFEIHTANASSVLAFSASLKDENALIAGCCTKDITDMRIVYSTKDQLSEPALSADGTVVAVAQSIPEEDDETWDIILFRIDDHSVISRKRIKGGHSFPLAIDEYKKILITTNTRGNEEPAWLDIITETISFFQDKPTYDTYTLACCHTSTQLLCCVVKDATHSLLKVETLLPGENIGPKNGSFDIYFGGGHFLADGSILFRHQSSTDPPSILKISAKKEKESSVPILLSESPSCLTFESITFTSSNGTQVQAWAAYPNNMKKPLPFIIDVHGGPHGIALDAFSPEAQAWLDHGIGYCAVNYRGSISFGKDFEQAIRGNPGHHEVEDCVHAKQELVKRGWAQEDLVFLSGWSWGGYVTLLAMGKEPNHWAGGIAAIPIADWHEQYKMEPAYLQSFDRELFGGSPDEVPERYTKASPRTYISKIRSPILILAGKNDSRCPIEQIDSYVLEARLKKINIKFEKFDGGHVGAFGNAQIGINVFTMAKEFIANMTPLRDNF